MLLKDDKKGMMTIIMKRLSDGSSKNAPNSEQEGPVNDNSIALDSSAEEILAALASKDAKKLKEALYNFVCLSMDEEEADGSSEPY